ncbi:hypothetical protein HPP92_016208 [Vanilla planifolia]|uniref:Transmembrane protein n=1 Tax=Vanilla planifolia TaxID=51239 RepID=A0A835UPW6_VANPL|nr:hypothetical protein HPP92_016208 [Vanilla planifolia]
MDLGSEPVVVRTAPALSPKSPPNYPDLCGRRRLQHEVQILNREIGFLEVNSFFFLTLQVLDFVTFLLGIVLLVFDELLLVMLFIS